MDNYNPTCAKTGIKKDLRMYAFRDSENNMIGWVFLHEDIDPGSIELKVEHIKPDEEGANVDIVPR